MSLSADNTWNNIQRFQAITATTVTATSTVTAGSFNSTSDKRVKNNTELLDPQSSLEAIRELRPTKYDFIDSNSDQIGFIAQEIKEIPLLKPAIHDTGTEFIPNIYKDVLCENGWFSSDVLLNISDRIRYKKDEKYLISTIQSSENGRYRLDDEYTGTIFVYGKEVHDFHSIQKDMIFTIAVSAIQRLDNIVTKQQQTIDELKKEIKILQSR